MAGFFSSVAHDVPGHLCSVLKPFSKAPMAIATGTLTLPLYMASERHPQILILQSSAALGQSPWDTIWKFSILPGLPRTGQFPATMG